MSLEVNIARTQALSSSIYEPRTAEDAGVVWYQAPWAMPCTSHSIQPPACFHQLSMSCSSVIAMLTTSTGLIVVS